MIKVVRRSHKGQEKLRSRPIRHLCSSPDSVSVMMTSGKFGNGHFLASERMGQMNLVFVLEIFECVVDELTLDYAHPSFFRILD